MQRNKKSMFEFNTPVSLQTFHSNNYFPFILKYVLDALWVGQQLTKQSVSNRNLNLKNAIGARHGPVHERIPMIFQYRMTTVEQTISSPRLNLN